jgi:hypothetical protein
MKVISNAQKIVLGVPEQENAAPAAFPEGANVSSYGQDNDTPIIVVCNQTETPPSWQGANAEGYVIINAVPFELAEPLLGVLGPEYTLEQLRSLARLLSNLGYSDQYTTSSLKLFTPAGVNFRTRGGFMKRDDRDVCEVTLNDGGSLGIIHPGSDEPKLIQPDILIRDYRLSDGGPITEEALQSLLR